MKDSNIGNDKYPYISVMQVSGLPTFLWLHTLTPISL